jgi:hypothetical protein
VINKFDDRDVNVALIGLTAVSKLPGLTDVLPAHAILLI